jgi:hypothetical protein
MIEFKWQLAANVTCWYALTIASTIFAKHFLSVTNDPFVLSSASFLWGLFALIFFVPRVDIKILFKRKTFYAIVAILHIGTTLMTNIGLTTSTVSFTYMIKVIKSAAHFIHDHFLIDLIIGSQKSGLKRFDYLKSIFILSQKKGLDSNSYDH